MVIDFPRHIKVTSNDPTAREAANLIRKQKFSHKDYKP